MINHKKKVETNVIVATLMEATGKQVVKERLVMFIVLIIQMKFVAVYMRIPFIRLLVLNVKALI
jgi:hypothetical protein